MQNCCCYASQDDDLQTKKPDVDPAASVKVDQLTAGQSINNQTGNQDKSSTDAVP